MRSKTEEKVMSDYDRIEKAIEYIVDHVDDQPSLEDVAKHLSLSPHHFQRLFTRWAGISPKRFLQTLTVQYAKKLLEESSTVMEATHELGLSSSARLHDHFVTLEGITPGEFKSKGEGLEISFGIHDCPFGEVFLATTKRGICHLIFLDQDQRQADIGTAIFEIQNKFHGANLQEEKNLTKPIVKRIFSNEMKKDNVPVIAIGTNFQINVWKALLQIPSGQVSTYGAIAKLIGNPKASRAVGSAVGANPISFIIPCHRVIQSTGVIGNYRWGSTRKKAILGWEST